MIEIIKESVKMPKMDSRRFQVKSINSKKWQVIDSQTGNEIRYESSFENVMIACHNLNKKFYRDNPEF